MLKTVYGNSVVTGKRKCKGNVVDEQPDKKLTTQMSTAQPNYLAMNYAVTSYNDTSTSSQRHENIHYLAVIIITLE